MILVMALETAQLSLHYTNAWFCVDVIASKHKTPLPLLTLPPTITIFLCNIALMPKIPNWAYQCLSIPIQDKPPLSPLPSHKLLLLNNLAILPTLFEAIITTSLTPKAVSPLPIIASAMLPITLKARILLANTALSLTLKQIQSSQKRLGT